MKKEFAFEHGLLHSKILIQKAAWPFDVSRSLGLALAAYCETK